MNTLYIKVAVIAAFSIFLFLVISDFGNKKITEAEVVGECAANSLLGSTKVPCDPTKILRESHKSKE